ncbi:LamG-like jellyroll fold domain-containing protein [Phytomonospora sp. NPDC050363]|uniref:LamG-like jellyroll fold domain-containing protein n=1 Tax=Phytomonospora sp. NPDC050363 TaxID=3155642 RepID=UPI0033FEFCE7
MRRWITFAAIIAGVVLGAPVQAADRAELVLNFDARPAGQNLRGPWSEGCFPDAVTLQQACIRTEDGGSVSRTEREAGPGGPAIGFPAPGDGTAILFIPHSDLLNPGDRDFDVSALIDMTATEGRSGSNLVQKGRFGEAGGQWKLQVDKGVPSCRIAGVRDDRRVAAIATGPSIAGQGWVHLHCERRGASLTITVDGGVPVTSSNNAGMNIANMAETTIGGRVTGTADNDQLHGEIDRVIVDIHF